MWELNLWCYKYKDILDKIESEMLEDKSQWDDDSDQTFINDKSFINDMTQRYIEENQFIWGYLKRASLVDLTDAYLKSKSNKYEPGEQRDAGTIISNMLNKVIKNQNLEEEKDWIAFYNVQELGRGTFGAVSRITTNSVVVGIEAKIAVKTIFDKPKGNG